LRPAEPRPPRWWTPPPLSRRMAAAVLISGVASAQVYAPSPPAPPGTLVVPAPPVPVPGTTTTTTVTPNPDGDHAKPRSTRRWTGRATRSSRRMSIAKGSLVARRPTRKQRLTGTVGRPQLARQRRDSSGLWSAMGSPRASWKPIARPGGSHPLSSCESASNRDPARF